MAAKLHNSESWLFDHKPWSVFVVELHNSMGYTFLDHTYIRHGHELRRMLEFSFIAADSKGVSVSRPARD